MLRFVPESSNNMALFKVIVFTLYHGKSLLNHHLGEYVLELFAKILYKSKAKSPGAVFWFEAFGK